MMDSFCHIQATWFVEIVVRRLGLTMINLHTRFDVSKFTHYDGTKGNAKCRNWDGLGWLGSPKVIGNVIIRIR